MAGLPACAYAERMAVRLVLAEDNLIVREGVRQLLGTIPEIELVAVCTDRDGLIDAAELHQPDAIVTDIRMPPGNADEGIQVAERLRRTSPATGVVVLSQYSDAEYALRLFEQGGFEVLETHGNPAPFALALGSSGISGLLFGLNKALIRMMRSVFSFQIVMVVRARPSLEFLLQTAQHQAAKRGSQGASCPSSGI